MKNTRKDKREKEKSRGWGLTKETWDDGKDGEKKIKKRKENERDEKSGGRRLKQETGNSRKKGERKIKMKEGGRGKLEEEGGG